MLIIISASHNIASSPNVLKQNNAEVSIKHSFYLFTLMGTSLLNLSATDAVSEVYTELGMGKTSRDNFVATVGLMTEKKNISYRLGLSVINDKHFEESNYLGLNGGVRFYTNNDLTPFLGLGLFTGYHADHYLAEDDDLDNDNDGSIDEDDEMDTDYSFIISVYPELGLRYKINTHHGLTASAQYHVTSEGHEHNFWIYNLGYIYSF